MPSPFLSGLTCFVLIPDRQKARKILTEKIAQLNSAIDDVSAQLCPEDTPNGAVVNWDELETTIGKCWVD
ncbi:hypothetical protein Nepgr_020740 [Nepenthes gracilis]|uniref:Uncharacterized protein n=1 Tax=Nepenthes gracilis TaxID=150966 RepID=A0AAD3XWD5_NEPGR|nr:hypothetical protein Nepgr_020740 [Nepenthes gracilis]